MLLNKVFKLSGGISAILSGVLLLSGHLLDYFSGFDQGTVIGKSIVFIAHIIAVFAFVGIYEFQGQRNRSLGLLGMILSCVGTIIVSSIVYVEIASASGVNAVSVFNQTVPSFIRTVGPLMFVVGMLMLGISIMLVNILPRVGGLLLIAGDLIFAISSLLGNLEPIFSVIGSAITCAGFVFLGVSLLNQKETNSLSV
jgi:hypothetical protein